jgi:DNA-binding MarR family transcriptional regulator
MAAHGSEGLLPFVEMLFFAYRDFTGEADTVLAAYGLGRAHHRVLHFVNRHPAIRVADLLGLLKITKQSLGRVLRQLVQDGWIEQMPGPDDRRERRLTLTERGRTLAAELVRLQTQRIETALGEMEAVNGAEPREHVRRFLFALIAADERATVTSLVAGAAGTDAVAKPEVEK